MSVNVEEYVKSYQRGYRNGRADAERIARYGYDPDTWTNADRIHNMSDEELARFLSKSTACPAWADKSFCCRAEESCSLSADMCWVDWLKQETTDELP